MLKKFSPTVQFLICFSLIAITSVTFFFLHDYIGYRGVALIYLLNVSVCAMLFDVYPVLATALLSAIILNFLFIPPVYTFRITTTEDVLMFFMYLFIALINAVLNVQIRGFERKKRDEEKKTKTIALYNTLLNSLSHEVRTPIATIIGAVDTLKDSSIKLSGKNTSQLYTEIEIAGFRLNRQVENLLNMSRLEAGTVTQKLDWYDVNELVFNVIKTNTEKAENHQIIFSPDEKLASVKIDGGFVEILLQNLVHNALQHTPAESTISLKIKYKSQKLIINVSDDGPGFPDDKIDVVFEKFYKLDGRSTGGTGLGLSIVKGLTEAMHGKVRLKNKPKGGAQFIVKIPAEMTSVNPKEDE